MNFSEFKLMVVGDNITIGTEIYIDDEIINDKIKITKNKNSEIYIIEFFNRKHNCLKLPDIDNKTYFIDINNMIKKRNDKINKIIE